MRIVVCIRDTAVRQAVNLALRANGDVTDAAEDLEDAKIFCTFPVNALVLDDEDRETFKTIAAIRQARVSRNVSIIGLTLGDLKSRVALLNAGADDALDRPFHRDELVARIMAVVRRRQGSCEDFIGFGNLAFDLKHRDVSVNGKSVHLTKLQYKLCEILARAKGNLIARADIAELIWGAKYENLREGYRVIDVMVHHVRLKLQRAGSTASVLTIWGRGLMLGVPVVTHNAPKPKSRFVYDTTQVGVEQPVL